MRKKALNKARASAEAQTIIDIEKLIISLESGSEYGIQHADWLWNIKKNVPAHNF